MLPSSRSIHTVIFSWRILSNILWKIIIVVHYNQCSKGAPTERESSTHTHTTIDTPHTHFRQRTFK